MFEFCLDLNGFWLVKGDKNKKNDILEYEGRGERDWSLVWGSPCGNFVAAQFVYLKKECARLNH